MKVIVSEKYGSTDAPALQDIEIPQVEGRHSRYPGRRLACLPASQDGMCRWL